MIGATRKKSRNVTRFIGITRAPLFSRMSTYPSAGKLPQNVPDGRAGDPILLTQTDLIEILVGRKLQRQDVALQRLVKPLSCHLSFQPFPERPRRIGSLGAIIVHMDWRRGKNLLA